MPPTHLDAVRGVVAPAATLPGFPGLPRLPLALRAVVGGDRLRQGVVCGVEEQRRGALGDHGESGRDVALRHVMMPDVVGDDVAERVDARRLRQCGRDGVVEAGEPRRVHVLGARQLHLRRLLPRRLLDVLEQVALARGDEADRVARPPGPPGPSDAVHVRLGVGGDVEVDDVTDALDVESAGGDVRRDEDVELPVLELIDAALALHLRHVTVDRGGGVPAGAELLGQGLGLVLRADEDDHPVEVLHLEDAGQRVHLLRIRDDEVALGDVRVGRGLGLDRDLLRVAEVLLREAADLRGHRGGEQGDLLLLGGLSEDLLDVLREAHLQHLVRLVQHEVLELGEVEGALGQVVHDAAGGAHHDVHAAAEGGQLHTVSLTAVDGQHVHALHAGGVGLERLADLQRELTGRGEDEGLRRLLRDVEPLQHGQGEGGGLAGSGLRHADDIAAGEEGGNGRGLDGRRGLVAEILDGLEDRPGDAEVLESGGGRGLVGGVGGGHFFRGHFPRVARPAPLFLWGRLRPPT